MKVRAPGKLILSGEHAVVYGHPALAMAVNRYVTATLTQERLPQIFFDLSDLAYNGRLSTAALRRVKDKIKRKYHRFIQGDFSIRKVLQKPFELAQFALGLCAESLNLKLPQGMKIHLTSDIPIGCGMGSSAATILSVMYATSIYLDVPLTKEALYKLALETENMQHGYSSGLDLRVVLYGGCLYVHDGIMEQRPVPMFPLYLVNTGTPITTTGECVEKVAVHFQDLELGAAFAHVTKMMDAALQQSAYPSFCEAVKLNHALLNRIGVVPTKVQQFIADIEAAGGAAKICGAGAIAGDQAGVVLVMLDDQIALSSLSARYGYAALPIAGESRGVHAI